MENDEEKKNPKAINDGTSPATLLRKRIPSISVPRKFCMKKHENLQLTRKKTNQIDYDRSKRKP